MTTIGTSFKVSSMRFKLYATLLIILMTAGCGGRKTVRLLTDNLDSVPAVELFNRERNDFKVIVEYSDTPTEDLLEGVQADIIIGKNLNSEIIAEKLAPLNLNLSTPDIYKPLCVDGTDKTARLLPLSFNLPIVVFPDKYSGTLSNPIIIDPEEIKLQGKKFNKSSNGAFVRLGFMPLRYDDFIYFTALDFNAGFAVSGKVFSYDNDNIETCAWITDTNETTEMENNFQDKFGYIPDVKLLDDELILFSVTDLGGYFLLAEHDQKPLDFRYLAYDTCIPVKDPVFIGIRRDSGRKRKAMIFIRWLTEPENQKKLLDYKISRHIDSFGFFGGFSSLNSVNEQFMTNYYPALLGRIPQERYFGKIDYTGLNLPIIKRQVIVPWFRDFISGNTDKTLKDYYKEWLYYTITE